MCGSVENEVEVWDLFDVVVCLMLDSETLRRRLSGRTTNAFGSHPEEVAAAVGWNDRAESTYQRFGATIIDGSLPPAAVADAVLTAAGRDRAVAAAELPARPDKQPSKPPPRGRAVRTRRGMSDV